MGLKVEEVGNSHRLQKIKIESDGQVAQNH